MTVVVMICFARSGATVVNQCLGCLPNVVILSEVNPLGGGWGKRGPDSFVTVKAQARNWYQIELRSDNFSEGILELETICEDTGRQLVVRDWSFVNFVPHAHNDWNAPNRFLTLDALVGKCHLIPLALVRDAIDVWLSRGAPPVDQFFPNYLRFVRAIVEREMPIFRYEQFCRRPSVVIRQICQHTGLEYSDSYRNYASFLTVHGDVQTSGGSRGVRQGAITLLPRRCLPTERIAEVDQCAEMVEANSLLGYQASYHQTLWQRLGLNTIRTVLAQVPQKVSRGVQSILGR